MMIPISTYVTPIMSANCPGSILVMLRMLDIM
jgi:hypothetical protein